MGNDIFSKVPPRFKRNTRGLDVIQSVYAFAMALGLTDVFVGSKTLVNDILFGVAPFDDGRLLLTGLLLGNIILLGVRFFWVPRNLGDLIFKEGQCKALKSSVKPLSHYSVAFHLLMIVVHGAVFFLICNEFEYVVFVASSNLPLNPLLFTGYVIMHVCLLLINAAWIGLIKVQESRMESESRNIDDVGDVGTPGDTWLLNNLLCSLLAIAPFALLNSCHIGIDRCAAHIGEFGSQILNLGPFSPQQITVVFQPFARLAELTNAPNASLLWVLLVLLANSLLDLCNTGRNYLLFNDVEWDADAEQVVEAISGTSKASQGAA